MRLSMDTVKLLSSLKDRDATMAMKDYISFQPRVSAFVVQNANIICVSQPTITLPYVPSV